MLRIGEVTSDPPPCDAEWFVAGQRLPVSPEQDLSTAWQRTRSIATTPVTGVAYGYAKARGMGVCGVGPITVAFLPHSAKTSGTTVGDVFLTQVQPGLTEHRAQQLARHESRHVTQWTVLTLAGGPLALPVLYSVDEIFFPGPRNHFERDAGLGHGGYRHPPGFGPQPLWAASTVLGFVLLALAWPRLRWLSRWLAGGMRLVQVTETGRCPLHTRRWLRGD